MTYYNHQSAVEGGKEKQKGKDGERKRGAWEEKGRKREGRLKERHGRKKSEMGQYIYICGSSL